MKKSLLIFAAAALWTARVVHGQAAGDAIPDQYIISVAPGVDPAALAANHALAPKFVYRTAANGLAGFVPPGRLRALQTDPRVMGITPDRRVSVDGKPGGGGGGTAQVVPLGVQRVGAAPGTVSFTGVGVGVAIVDTGLDFNHNDLKPLGSASYSAVSASAQDDNGHGTHVGGIVAARNNSSDVVGVAPGATLYSVKVLDSAGNGSDATVMAGLDWIAQNANAVNPHIRVVNMSLGRAGSIDDNPALRQAVQTVYGAGISIVVSAGNSCSVEVSSNVPATYPEVFAIASTAAADGAKNKWGQFIPKDTASYFGSSAGTTIMNRIAIYSSKPSGNCAAVAFHERQVSPPGFGLRRRSLRSRRFAWGGWVNPKSPARIDAKAVTSLHYVTAVQDACAQVWPASGKSGVKQLGLALNFNEKLFEKSDQNLSRWNNTHEPRFISWY